MVTHFFSIAATVELIKGKKLWKTTAVNAQVSLDLKMSSYQPATDSVTMNAFN